MAHSLPHNLKNLRHSQITTAHRHLSMYVHIVFMRFLCGLQRFVPFFYLSKPHGTPSTLPLEDQEFYMSFSLADSHSYPGKIYPENAFPSGTPGTFQHWTTQHNGTEIFKVPLDSVIFTRSYEVFTRSVRDRDIARHGSRDLFYSSLLCSTPL